MTATAPGALATTSRRALGGALWLAVADLRFRVRRFVVAVVAAALALMLLLLMTGIVNQFDREVRRTTDAIGGEYWVMRNGVDSPFTSSAGIYSETLAAGIVTEGTTGFIYSGGLAVDSGSGPTDALVVGHPPDGLGRPVTSKGRLAESPGEVAVSSAIGVDVGDTVVLAGNETVVTGLIPNVTLYAGMPMIFLPIDVIMAAVGSDQILMSAFLTDTEPTAVPDELQVLTRSEVAAAALGPVEQPAVALDIMRILLTMVAAMIIGAVVYLASIERTRDVAVFRAVGVEGPVLASGVAAQALAMAAVASVIAVVLAVLIAPVFPMEVYLRPIDLAMLPLAAAIIAMVASYFAIRRTLRIEPSEAFAAAGS